MMPFEQLPKRLKRFETNCAESRTDVASQEVDTEASLCISSKRGGTVDGEVEGLPGPLEGISHANSSKRREGIVRREDRAPTVRVEAGVDIKEAVEACERAEGEA